MVAGAHPGRVPGHRVRGARVLGAEVVAVELELDAGDAGVVRRVRGDAWSLATTVEPPAGAVIETVGGVVSGGRVVKLHVWAPASAIPLAARTVDSSRTV